MNNISIWIILAVVFFIIAAILFIVSIMLFVRLEIVSVIGFLTGKTQARQVREIKAQAVKSGKYNYKSPNISGANHIDDIVISSGSKTQRAQMQKEAHASKRLDKPVVNNVEVKADRFSKFHINSNTVDDTVSIGHSINPDSQYNDEQPTDMLNQTEESTELLSVSDNYEDATELLNNENETDILDEDYEEGTAVLSSNDENSKLAVQFDIVSDDTQILTDEVIE